MPGNPLFTIIWIWIWPHRLISMLFQKYFNFLLWPKLIVMGNRFLPTFPSKMEPILCSTYWNVQKSDTLDSLSHIGLVWLLNVFFAFSMCGCCFLFASLVSRTFMYAFTRSYSIELSSTDAILRPFSLLFLSLLMLFLLLFLFLWIIWFESYVFCLRIICMYYVHNVAYKIRKKKIKIKINV